jgi:3-oxo-5alpha-steroid 4-dehydrogenase
MAAFLRAALGPAVDEDKLQAYVAGSVEHYDWLVARGVPFTPGLYDDPSWMPPTDDGLMWLGERSWPFTELATPAPRGHRPATGHFGGWLLMERLATAARDAGTREVLDTLAERLVVDGDRVVGVVARQYGEPRTYLPARPWCSPPAGSSTTTRCSPRMPRSCSAGTRSAAAVRTARASAWRRRPAPPCGT